MTEQEILQKNLIQFLVKDVFNTVSEDDLLRIERSSDPRKSDQWFHKGEVIPEAQVKILKAQAQTHKESLLWKILRDELLYQSYEKGFIKSKTEADIITGKLLKYLVDVIDSKLEAMRS